MAEKSSNIRILGATGFNTFGGNTSFLNDVIKNSEGQIDIILLDPSSDNEAAKERASQLGQRYDDYRKEIVDSVKMLKKLKGEGKHIQLYFYHHQPQWKLFFNDDHVWCQHYDQGRHVCESPVYGFRKMGGGRAFYDYFLTIFLRKVDKLKDKSAVDLDNWSPDDPQ